MRKRWKQLLPFWKVAYKYPYLRKLDTETTYFNIITLFIFLTLIRIKFTLTGKI